MIYFCQKGKKKKKGVHHARFSRSWGAFLEDLRYFKIILAYTRQQ